MQFHPTESEPRKPRGRVEIQSSHSVFDLSTADLVIFQNLRFAIRNINFRPIVWWPRNCTKILVVWPVFGPRPEFRFGGLQVQVGVKKSVIGNMPELIGIAGGEPQSFRALGDRLQEHFERCAVLPSQHFMNVQFRQRNHPRFSTNRAYYATPRCICTLPSVGRQAQGVVGFAN